MRPAQLELGPDFAGLRVKLIQAGPREFVAVVETEWGEELGRSPRYLPSPYAALAQAIESITAHQAKEGGR